MSVEQQIIDKLNHSLSPVHLQVQNESYMHNVPKGSESHFKVVVVSEQFDGLRLLARHRLVNQALAAELAGPVHALAIHTYTPEQWQSMQDTMVPNSPNCMGKDK
ncbi:BolA family protein [Thalassotalea aquiviva]|uniref:BolA family protein n=1 Tax=Thalassotalea aquiviva TaxID=3242415 RepID=UPI003529F8BA